MEKMKLFILLSLTILSLCSCAKSKKTDYSEIYFEKTGCFNYSEKYLLVFDSKNIEIKKIKTAFPLYPSKNNDRQEADPKDQTKKNSVYQLFNLIETVKSTKIEKNQKNINRINDLILCFKEYDKNMCCTSNDKLVLIDHRKKTILNLTHYSKNEVDSFKHFCEEAFKHKK
jgi:hypothetical protein